MILSKWSVLVYRNGFYSSGISKRKFPIDKVKCDRCETTFEQREDKTKIKFKKYNEDLCKKCIKEQENKRIAKLGSSILSSFSKEEKIKYSSYAGKQSTIKCPNNSGRFTTKRWDSMTKKEQMEQVMRANKALHDKLNNDEDFRNKHYLKVFKNSRIGFISKGHNELHEFLQQYNFKQHYVIDKLEIDECCIEKKLVVEYNGDYYHCNPKKYNGEFYNKSIKMFCHDKWEKDRDRIWFLRRNGYKVFIVWEDEWYNNRALVKEKLIKFINKNETNK